MMNKDTTKRTSSERRADCRRQNDIPVKLERRLQADRRTGIDRRLKPAK